MSETASRWDDLKTRILTAVLMSIVGIGAILLGGLWFTALVALVAGLMVWELIRMGAPISKLPAIVLGSLAAIIVGQTLYIGTSVSMALVAAFLVLTFLWVEKDRSIFAVYGAVILLACLALVLLRTAYGVEWIVWLVLVVVATDTAGYFAGRFLGGPKFWPRVSPKKTWSGTVAGWIGAAIVGLLMSGTVGMGGSIVILSVFVSFASQMGDVAESAIKRRVGVKDASNLLPGHGGLLDRFDGLIGAALVTLLMLLFSYSPVAAGI